jgi:hypothetical protein
MTWTRHPSGKAEGPPMSTYSPTDYFPGPSTCKYNLFFGLYITTKNLHFQKWTETQQYAVTLKGSICAGPLPEGDTRHFVVKRSAPTVWNSGPRVYETFKIWCDFKCHNEVIINRGFPTTDPWFSSVLQQILKLIPTSELQLHTFRAALKTKLPHFMKIQIKYCT